MTEQAVGSIAGQDAATLLDAAVARSYGVVPIAVEDGELVLGMPDTSDTQALRTLRVLAGMDVRAVSMTAAGIAEAQRDLYPDEPALVRPPGSSTLRESPGERERHRAAAEEAGVQFVSLRPHRDGRDPVNPLTAQLLDEGFCRHFKIVAVAADNGVVVLATATPSDAATVRVAARMAGGGEPLVVSAAPSDIEYAITRAFSVPVSLPGERARAGRRKLGEMLLDSGLLDDDGLARALRTQERTGDPLGEILVHSGIVAEERLAAALAEQLRLALVRVDAAQLDADVLGLIPQQLMLRHRMVPIAVERGQLVVAMVDPLDDAALASLAEHATLPVRRVLGTDTEIDRALQAITAPERVERAADELMQTMPESSAHYVLTRQQKLAAGLIGFLFLAGLLINPLLTIIVFNAISVTFYLAFSLYRLKLVHTAFVDGFTLRASPVELAALDERRLPRYSILVPLYREANVIGGLVDAITKLDYPPAKLDVLLLCEEDDMETIAAIRTLDPPPHFRLVVVPDNLPKTKPKACNYGLAHARGELVVIYDAEDRPEADQLKKIVVAYTKCAEDVVCIQCKLNYHNHAQNLLTKWFTTEYSMWFDLFMPGLDAADSPIPLGGTSNHFVTEQLRELGAWDAYNVTEDADLGVRLSRAGYRTAMVDSTTLEEANSDLGNWIRQRSRWVKGYIQTWLVHMRQPRTLARQLGWRRFWSFQLVIAGTFVGFLLNPLYWMLTTVWLLTEAHVIQEVYPSYLYFAAAIALHFGNFAFAYVNAAGSMRRDRYELVKYALFSPAYWALMSVAAWKGALQLITKPFYWEKTTHGLDNRSRNANGS